MPNILARTQNRLFLISLITISLLSMAYMFMVVPKASAAPCALPSTDYGTVTSTVTIPQSGSYRIWSRMVTPNATDNSYLLEIDGNTCFTVGDGSFNAGTWATNSSNWVDYQNGTTSSKINMTLSAGTHTIKMIGNAPNVELDRVVFTSDTSCVPTGTGDNCANPPDTTNPTVSLTAPANNSVQYNNANITIRANASDDTGGSGVQRVEFWIDGAKISGAAGEDRTSPYEVTIAGSSLSVGSHTIVAKAFDVAGNTASSGAVTINVTTPPDTTDPTVSITAPANNSTHSTSTTVTAQASDNVGVTKVEFRVNGTLKDTAYPPNFNMPLNIGDYTNGTYTIVARAYDAANRQKDSSPITITINKPVTPPPDTANPTVSLTSPMNNTPQKGTIKVTASASDDVGVAHVELYVDGQKVGNNDTTAPYEFDLDTTKLTQGARQLRVRAVDTSGKATNSSIVTINVNNVTYIDEDVDMDGIVGMSDIGRIIGKYRQPGGSNVREDVDKSGTIDMSDIGRVIGRYNYGR